LGLKVQGYFMIGAPTESLEEIKKTIRLAKSLDIDEATFSITTPLPETHLYDKTRQYITEDVSDFDYYKTPVYGCDIVLPKDRLKRLKQQALLSFYLSPGRILNTLRGFASPAAIKKSCAKLKRF
jgi:anaerobic magnesium-protoporphyrin IX monomethyl ester cyclase